MRCLVAVFLLAACDDNSPVPSDAVVTTRGELDALRAEVAALRDAVGAPVDVPDVRPIVARLDALEKRMGEMEKRGAAKVPHLVVMDGTDLGPAIGEQCALSEMGGTLCFAAKADPVYYDGADCSGAPFTLPQYAREGYLMRGVGGRVYRLTGDQIEPTLSSVQRQDGVCFNAEKPYRIAALGLRDVGAIPAYKPGDVWPELR